MPEPVQRYELSSYKKDAINLIANRIQKKLREVFSAIQDFS